MNGTIGIMCACEACGKEVFRKAIGGRYLLDKDGIRYESIQEYEPLPDGWAEVGGRLLCPICNGPHRTVELLGRLGATLRMTIGEEADIRGTDEKLAKKALRDVLKRGDYVLVGECYVTDGYGKRLTSINI